MGAAADDMGIQCGGWTIEWQGLPGDITPGTTVLEAIRHAVSEGTDVEYVPDGRLDQPAEFCLAVVGEEPYAEGEGDTADLSLPMAERAMLNRLPDQCDQIVVVLISGRPLLVTNSLDDWDALVAVWLPGTEGQGVTDVLFGDVPFTGRLSYTWPRSLAQLPLNAISEGDASPLFRFGHGLQY